jgi:hypothetical protein
MRHLPRDLPGPRQRVVELPTWGLRHQLQVRLIAGVGVEEEGLREVLSPGALLLYDLFGSLKTGALWTSAFRQEPTFSGR